MYQEILDYRLQHYLQGVIKELPVQQQVQLKNLALCNKRTIPQIGVSDTVFLLRNENNEAKFFGQMTCKNTWACPHCAAKRMKEYATKIAACIDALNKQGQKAIMITFTVPHLQFQSCKEVTDILYQTWQTCFQNATNKKRNRTFNVFNRFYREHGINYRIRAAEYTYGKNGWHPHFHCLFFVNENTFDSLLKWEDDFNKQWQKIFKIVATKYINSNKLHQNIGTAEAVVNRLSKFMTSEFPAIKISRDKDGKPLETTSSAYIAGWTTDKEMTGNVQKKASHIDHYTPHQILEMAADGDKKMKDLYIEFCLQVTRKPVHHRVDFSVGLSKIATVQIQQVGYREVLKKKSNRGKWEVFCWFTSTEWELLCYSDCPALENLLYYASINRKDLLQEYLREVFDLQCHDLTTKLTNHVEKIFNAA